MARTHDAEGTRQERVLTTDDLHGRSVMTQDGERIGRLHSFDVGTDGAIETLHVRERWMLGKHRSVPARGMSMVDDTIVVPCTMADLEPREEHVLRDDDREHREVRRLEGEDRIRDLDDGTVASERTPVAPVTRPAMVAGREGARRRFGGADLLASFFGTLVALAATLLVGGLLAALANVEAIAVETNLDTTEGLVTAAAVATFATLFLAYFIGGWAAGRMARYDGVLNGLLLTAWTAVIALVFAGLGAWVGEEYDAFSGVGLPSIEFNDATNAGLMAAGIALALMLLGGALGGAVGAAWHRRADDALLDPVDMH